MSMEKGNNRWAYISSVPDPHDFHPGSGFLLFYQFVYMQIGIQEICLISVCSPSTCRLLIGFGLRLQTWEWKYNDSSAEFASKRLSVWILFEESCKWISELKQLPIRPWFNLQRTHTSVENLLKSHVKKCEMSTIIWTRQIFFLKSRERVNFL